MLSSALVCINFSLGNFFENNYLPIEVAIFYNCGTNMSSAKKNIDMLNASLWDKILLFTLPIAASSILQQLFNSADLAVVGRFAGSQAVAAVGSNAPVINLIINIFVGLSVGANVVIGNLLGRKNEQGSRDAAHTAIFVSIISGFILIAIGFFSARPILLLMGTPDDVLEYAVVYLRIYFAGMPFVMLYNFGSAILRSKGDTKRPLYSLILGGALNVIFNLIFVVVFHLDVAGVALATVISNIVSSFLVLYFLMNEELCIRIDLKKLKIHRDYLIQMIKIGVPAGLQGMVFSLSNIVIQSAINSFGASAMAGSAAELNYEYYTFFVVSGFNQTTVSFTSQNFGARNIERCKKIYRLCMLYSVGIVGLMVFAFVVFRNFFIGIYTVDPVAIEYGVLRMLIVESFDCLIATYEISASTLRAMGHSLLPAIETIFGVCLLRVIWVYTVFGYFRNTLDSLNSFGVLMAVYPVSWVITGCIVVSTYFYIRKKEFARIKAE